LTIQKAGKIFFTKLSIQFTQGNFYTEIVTKTFVFTVSANFILNPEQWELILEHWEQKESIKIIETL
jgi:hypothetical protein